MSARWTGPVRNPFTELVRRSIAPIAKTVGVSFFWATVTAAYPDPVQVVPDGPDTDPLPGVPSMLCTVGLGDRVLVLLWGTRMVVLGVAQPDQSRDSDGQFGTVDIVPTAANTPTSVHVTFDVPFDEVPNEVQVTPYTSVPGTQVLGVGATNVTTDGMDIVLTRTNTNNTTVWWSARV